MARIVNMGTMKCSAVAVRIHVQVQAADLHGQQTEADQGDEQCRAGTHAGKDTVRTLF